MLDIILASALPVALVVGFFVGRNNPSLGAINSLLAKGKHIVENVQVAIVALKKPV